MTNPVTQTFIPGPRLIDGTDLNALVAQTNAGLATIPTQTTIQVGTLNVSGLAALHTTNVSSLVATQLAAFVTVTVGTLTSAGAISAPNSGTFTNNGTTPVTVTAPTVTANSAIIITLKTVGGTVGATPHVATITAATGFTTVGTASDTSVYNYTIIG